MSQIPTSLITMTIGVVVTLISLWVGQNHGLLPEQASAQAPLVDSLFNLMITIGTALFIVVQGAILWFLIRFRKPKGDESDGVPVEGNLPLEAFWTAIPAVIVIGVAIYSVNVFQEMGGLAPDSHPMMSHKHPEAVVAQASLGKTPVAGDTLPLLADDATLLADGSTIAPGEIEYGYGADPTGSGLAPDLLVDVTGIQYAWLFNYPDSGIITGELHIPVDRTVQLRITAQDVIHSFWVPNFRMKQDAIPGEETGLRFTATKVGNYPVVCAELCGSYHGGMRSRVIVHEQTDYDAWVAQNSPNPTASSGEVAVNPMSTADMNDRQYLSPVAETLGVNAQALAHLHESDS
ncbi:MAG: cytochrome c oxidase subunit II [Cyanobacteria bacterium J06638_20]